MGLDISFVPLRIGEVMDGIVNMRVIVIKYSGKNNCDSQM